MRAAACFQLVLRSLRTVPRLRLLAELGFFVAALWTTLPLFAGRYVPIQDLPQHAAAVRVLFDYSDPALRFEEFFVRQPFATQYLSVYALAGVLSWFVDAVLACKLVLALSMVALPYSLRLLLSALGKPQSLALLALPLAHNVFLLLGFMNFLAGLPLLLVGLAFAVRLARRDSRNVSRTVSRKDAIGLGVVAFVCFYTHVIPFGLLALGVLFIALETRSLDGARRVLVPMTPAVLAAVLWLSTNPTGSLLARLVFGASDGPAVELAPPDQALAEISAWLLDVVPSNEDQFVLIAWCLVVVAVFVTAASPPGPPSLARSRRAIGWLVPLALLGYFALPAGYGFIWPINARFPLVALILLIAVLPRPPRAGRVAVAVAALVLAVVSTRVTFEAFRSVMREESAGLPPILDRIPLGSRVAALAWGRSSRFVRYNPQLHTAGWIQAERGGAVMFSFADFPHSPFRFRDSNRPPRVPPRWEWLPGSVDPAKDLSWFDYVVTRKGPENLASWRRIARSGLYSLWVKASAEH